MPPGDISPCDKGERGDATSAPLINKSFPQGDANIPDRGVRGLAISDCVLKGVSGTVDAGDAAWALLAAAPTA